MAGFCVLLCVFSDMEMFSKEEGGFKDYEKKIIRGNVF